MALATPSCVGSGTLNSSNGGAAASFAWPAGTQSGDIGVLHIENAETNANTAATGTGANLNTQGWQVISENNQPAALTVQLVYWLRATGVMANAVAYSSSNHQQGGISTYRGALQTGTPYQIVASGQKSASSIYAFPSITTTINNSLIVYCLGDNRDVLGNNLSTYTGPSLANPSLTLVHGANISNNHGGGMYTLYGGLATAGATGTMSGTLAGSAASNYTLFNLIPSGYPETSGVVAGPNTAGNFFIFF